MIAVAAVNDAGNNMFAGVLLHQVKTALVIDGSFHNASDFQRSAAQVYHIFTLFLHIQHLCAS